MSVLPPPQKDGEIKFFIARGLPYRTRMALVGAILAAGLALQVTLGFWPGLVVLVLGQLLGMNSGYDSAPRRLTGETWERVTPDEYAKVRKKGEELKRWDQDFFDGTSSRGMAGFVLTAAVCAGLYLWAAIRFALPADYWLYFGLDAAVLLLPLWFIGTRDYLKKPGLLIKIGLLEKVMDALRDTSEAQVHPMLALAATEGGGREPEDARLMVKLVGARQDFYGVQVQVSLNSVQGKDFPYLYCVLIAKAGGGLLRGWEDLRPKEESSLAGAVMGFLFGGINGVVGTPGLVYEPQNAGDVDIIVVRQKTTRSGGYYTPPAAAGNVVRSALKLAQALLVKNGAGAPGTVPEAPRI